MKKIIFGCLALYLSNTAFAGGVLLCDEYGNICIRPGGINCELIPPVHGCSQDEIDDLLNPRIRSNDTDMSIQGWNPNCYGKGPLCDK